MALIHYMTLNELEEMLVYTHVKDEMNYFIELTDKNKHINKLHTSKFNAYKTRATEKNADYPFLNDLPPGIHELDINDLTYTISIKEINGFRYAVLYDETEFENREAFYLLRLSLSIILAILFSLWFGYWISRKIISPVKTLSKQVKQLQASQLKLSLAGFYADDEVGLLAKTFDEFIKKIQFFIERERNFTADASHELRTPLTIIQGAVEILLAQNELPEENKKRLQRIERAVHDMQQTLSALLVLAREPIENELTQNTTNISKVIDELSQSLQPVYLKENVDYQVTIVEDATIPASENIVSILVGNLIRNALIYTDKGQINITLEADTLRITDTGIGMSEDDLRHAFERGFRGSNASEQGSGLGLSLSKKICDYFNWSLEIESQFGIGTTITWKFAHFT